MTNEYPSQEYPSPEYRTNTVGRRHPVRNKPVRYLLMPAGQGKRYRPLPGTKSHVGTTWAREDVPRSQKHDFRRTLCGIVMRRETNPSRRWEWIRYYWTDKIEWDRVTCGQCRRYMDKWK